MSKVHCNGAYFEILILKILIFIKVMVSPKLNDKNCGNLLSGRILSNEYSYHEIMFINVIFMYYELHLFEFVLAIRNVITGQ